MWHLLAFSTIYKRKYTEMYDVNTFTLNRDEIRYHPPMDALAVFGFELSEMLPEPSGIS